MIISVCGVDMPLVRKEVQNIVYLAGDIWWRSFLDGGTVDPTIGVVFRLDDTEDDRLLLGHPVDAVVEVCNGAAHQGRIVLNSLSLFLRSLKAHRRYVQEMHQNLRELLYWQKFNQHDVFFTSCFT